MVMAAQLWKYTKNCLIVYFKWVKCMTCELHLNKAVIVVWFGFVKAFFLKDSIYTHKRENYTQVSLTNWELEFLTKILAINTQNQAVFILGIQIWPYFKESVNIIQNINKPREKYIIILINAKKAGENIQHVFSRKTPS